MDRWMDRPLTGSRNGLMDGRSDGDWLTLRRKRRGSKVDLKQIHNIFNVLYRTHISSSNVTCKTEMHSYPDKTVMKNVIYKASIVQQMPALSVPIIPHRIWTLSKSTLWNKNTSWTRLEKTKNDGLQIILSRFSFKLNKHIWWSQIFLPPLSHFKIRAIFPQLPFTEIR